MFRRAIRLAKSQNADANRWFIWPMRRGAILSATGGLLVGLLTAGVGHWPEVQAAVSRMSFVIATGPTGGTYFPIGEAIAGIVSHPPGVYRCERPGVCGPTGLIASVRTSQGAAANVLAVNAHTVDAALAQSDVVAEAVAGRGLFRRNGSQTHLRILASLYPEEVHLVALKSAHIRSLKDLRRKRVSVGPEMSGTMVTVRTILAAVHLPLSQMRADHAGPDSAAEKLAKGQIDALFFVGGAPVPLVRELLQGGRAVLVPIAAQARTALLKRAHMLNAATIPPGVYPNTGKVETVGVRAVLIANDSIPDSVAYGVVRALFNSANRNTLAGSHRSAQAIGIDTAASDAPAPLHPGAARFYKEMGKLPKTPQAKSGKT
jgi:TRAP transporter TAXI family solute receptor